MTTPLPHLSAGAFWYLPMDVVHYGRGSVTSLAGELDRLRVSRAFVITSPSTAAKSDVVTRVAGVLGDRYAGRYEGVRPHVPYSCLDEGLRAAREAGADVLIAVGGGSVVDAARAIALAVGEELAQAAELERFRARYEPPAPLVLPPTRGRALPIVAVPTTLSAAEFANAGAVTSETRATKDLLIADELTPRSVVLDPELAVATPVQLWVSTGMRALDHAIETVYSPHRTPVTDALSLDSIARLAASLRAAYRDGLDVEARMHGQIAAWMSYFGEMNLTLGLSHAIGHQIGAQFRIQHGVTSCIILPHVMRYLAGGGAGWCADRLALVAGALGVGDAGSDHDKALAAADAVSRLAADLGLPTRLSDAGIGSDSFPRLADAVLADPVIAGSPVPISTAGQIIEILDNAR